MTAVRGPARAALAAGAAGAAIGCLSACGALGSGSDEAHLAHGSGPVTALGSHALTVGETYHGDGATVTVRHVRQPMTSRQPGRLPTDPGDEWIGLDVKTCVDASSPRGVDAAWWTFAGLGKDSARYPALTWSKRIKPLPANNWPVPQYPTFGQIAPGQCQAGWLLLTGKKGKALRSVTYTDTAGVLRAEWKLSGG